MSEAVDIQLDTNRQVVKTPIVDLLYLEPVTNCFVITFIPEDAVSKNTTEAVEIDRVSDEGVKIEAWLTELGILLGLPGPVVKLFHRSGAKFGFYGPELSEKYLEAHSVETKVSRQAYAALQNIAQTSQIAFLQSKNPPAMKTLVETKSRKSETA